MSSDSQQNKGFDLMPFKIYGVGYLVLTVVALISAFGGKYEVEPKALIADKSFTADSFLRVADNYTFNASSGASIVLDSGDRVNEYVAQELISLIKNGKFPYSKLQLYKAGWFWNLHWGAIFTFYNLLGLFVGLYFGLKAPFTSMIDGVRSKTEISLSSARQAQAEAESLKQRYTEFMNELESEKARLADVLLQEQDLEKETILKHARHEAEGIVESIKSSIDGEIKSAAERLRTEIANQALLKAREILAKEITMQDHENAFNDFITDLERTSK